MANPSDVQKLLSQLHEQKIFNLDASIRSVLQQPDALRALDPNSVAAAVIAWDGYGLVIKGHAPDLKQIESVAGAVRDAVKGGPGW